MHGGPGLDWLMGGQGSDTMFGGIGDDIFVIRGGDVPEGGFELIDGGGGDDETQNQRHRAPPSSNLAASCAPPTLKVVSKPKYTQSATMASAARFLRANLRKR